MTCCRVFLDVSVDFRLHCAQRQPAQCEALFPIAVASAAKYRRCLSLSHPIFVSHFARRRGLMVWLRKLRQENKLAVSSTSGKSPISRPSKPSCWMRGLGLIHLYIRSSRQGKYCVCRTCGVPYNHRPRGLGVLKLAGIECRRPAAQRAENPNDVQGRAGFESCRYGFGCPCLSRRRKHESVSYKTRIYVTK